MTVETLLFAVIFGIVWIILPVVVYSDAKHKSSNSAFLWALVTVIAPLLGALIYVLVGRDGDDTNQSRPSEGDSPTQYR